MNALDRIAALHTPNPLDPTRCEECVTAAGDYASWPCPTRRLCDEALAPPEVCPHGCKHGWIHEGGSSYKAAWQTTRDCPLHHPSPLMNALADCDRWKADADRLAATNRDLVQAAMDVAAVPYEQAGQLRWRKQHEALRGAIAAWVDVLSAHDALVEGEGE